jgi:hypothetical protein
MMREKPNKQTSKQANKQHAIDLTDLSHAKK